MLLQRQAKPIYSFLDDLPKPEEKRAWRTCVAGVAPRCSGRVFGYKADRTCWACKIILNRSDAAGGMSTVAMRRST